MYNNKKLIMGLGGSNQDYSACLVSGGEILVAVEEERLSRKKYGIDSDIIFPHCREYCLATIHRKYRDVDSFIATDICNRAFLYGIKSKCKLMNHHLSHAASAFYTSPFRESTILVLDANGSYDDKQKAVETISCFIGQGTSIERIMTIWGKNPRWTNHVPSMESNRFADWLRGINNSLGFLYAKVSAGIGFNFVSDEFAFHTEDGKTMGLAPYGTDRYVTKFSELISFKKNNDLEVNSGDTEYLRNCIDHILLEREDDIFHAKADIAYALQFIFEKALLHLIKYIKKESGMKNLCMAGGVALNSVANGKIATSRYFENIHIPQAPGDSGTAIGCALYEYYHSKKTTKRKRNIKMTTGLGQSYSDRDIQKVLDKYQGILVDQCHNLYKDTAELLVRGKIVGWFQDGSEFGPRALGNRSILCLPYPAKNKDILNQRVKHREAFRPFAPVVLQAAMQHYFKSKVASPYMSFVVPAKKEKYSVIAAVVHVDGSSRIQTLTREMNEKLYLLLMEIKSRTAIPILLNTSFNIKGEPIIETPEDAVKCYLKTDLDVLIIHNYLITKPERE